MVAYCPECGSQVAPENTFCAYCGMNLTPLMAESSKGEASALPVSNKPEISDEANAAAPVVSAESESSAPLDSYSSDESSAPPVTEKTETAKPEEDFWDDLPAVKNESDDFAELKSSKDDFKVPDKSEENADESNDEWAVAKSSGNQLPAETSESSSFDWEVAPKTESNEPPVSKNQPGGKDQNPDLQRLKTAAEISSADKESFNQYELKDSTLSPSAELIQDEAEIPPPPAFLEDEIKESEKSENDLESTIPYTPFDFAQQENISESTTGQKPEEKVEATEPRDEFRSTEPPSTYSPIAMPDTPVGSSQHDSLMPKAISVQIFDPKDSPGEQTTDANDAQTLIKRETPSASNAEEAKPQTSPISGREDTDGRGGKVKLKPLDEGTVLNGRYEIVRKIGGGGMGAVYLASDRNLGGVLRAVKEMVQSYIEDSQQEKAVSDFKRESLLLTSLEHSAIPTIYDYFYDEKEGRFYLVMKYISGGDLSGRLRSTPEGKMDEASVTEWAIQIADVLDYLHNRQPPIIYRDLKPSNIMIDGNTGRAMLIDFGIARWVNKEEKGVTAVGTMGYAPPELFSGNVESRSDIYSLGSTMFHLLTGADPQSNPLLIFDFNKNPRPRQINSRLSDQIEGILMQMVEYNPERRFKSAAELRELLTTHLENLKKNAVTFGVQEQALGVGASPVIAKPAVTELVFCGFCGQKIMSTDVFCPFCGAQQPGAMAKSGKIEPPSYIAPKMTARLLIMSTNDLESPAFELEKDTNLVGRRDPMSNIFPEVDLSKYDPQTKISRRHARIWRERNAYMVEDLGSSNGTILYTQTNEPLRLGKNQPHVLAHGDKIRIGDTTLHFVVN